ncbi:phosphatidate cytidylyltransferase [Candidatus Mycoplasma haematolamae str. Purdue]|uniref:Phosphatidate cytidylyltransferase n=1 Tax=Mycoplasma haematolamae (strain Purdue) TaxID=1212765 RepID=I7CJ21_MYCHA|nr:phosphatidate cytidylyltransferase [Candidatus Mycoplasma haematolamae]AFO51874.1 phosphatidate cytidylyltransferase [Candidatus Mycoplasma haematolamae str. Purdue]
MSSLWFSNQERQERVKHFISVFGALFLLSGLVFLIQNESIKKGVSQIDFKDFSKPAQISGWVSLLFLGIWLVYKSLGEVLSSIVPPSLFEKAHRYHVIFTVIALCPLGFLAISKMVGSSQENVEVANITHYLFFQIYFLLGNVVAWKFLSKFLVPELSSSDQKPVKKAAGRLLRWHYLGWTSFFLLTFAVPIWALLLGIVIAFFNSSCAFVFGRKTGRLCLSCLSPSKTLEGAVWAVLVSVLLFGCLSSFIYSKSWLGNGPFAKTELFYPFIFVWVFLVSVVSQMGDHMFSVCKRTLGYKNFGRLFGCRIGGFWDRFDSIAPVLFFSLLSLWVVTAINCGSIGLGASKNQ